MIDIIYMDDLDPKLCDLDPGLSDKEHSGEVNSWLTQHVH